MRFLSSLLRLDLGSKEIWRWMGRGF